MHATDFLAKPTSSTGPLIGLYGTERYLKLRALSTIARVVLGPDNQDLGMTQFAGDETEFSTVMDELRTFSMFGSQRVVVVTDADDFVKDNRAALEKYLDKPAKKSVLILDLKSFPSTTRLYKRVDETGLLLDCAPLKRPQLVKWIGEHTQLEYGKKITRDAIERLLELRGVDLGPLDQELGKLSSYVGDRVQIDRQSVEKMVGGWKAETTWNMLDNLLDGHLDQSLHLLDKLITAGEHPIKLLGSVQYLFRPMARATEAVRQGQPLTEALTEAGIKSFNMPRIQGYLKRVGRSRAERIYHYLLTADRDLKGASQIPERAVMERLLWVLSGK